MCVSGILFFCPKITMKEDHYEKSYFLAISLSFPFTISVLLNRLAGCAKLTSYRIKNNIEEIRFLCNIEIVSLEFLRCAEHFLGKNFRR